MTAQKSNSLSQASDQGSTRPHVTVINNHALPERNPIRPVSRSAIRAGIEIMSGTSDMIFSEIQGSCISHEA